MEKSSTADKSIVRYTAILPSGRAVKFERLTTATYFAALERTGAKLGKIDMDRQGATLAREGKLNAYETIATCLKAITLVPCAWIWVKDESEADTDVPDIDAMLDAVEQGKDGGGGGFTSVSYLDLSEKGGQLGLDTLFDDELEDFTELNAHIERVSFPQRKKADALRKVRAGSGVL